MADDSGQDISSWKIFPKEAVGAIKHGSKGEPFFPKDYKILKRHVLQVFDVSKNNHKYYSIELHEAQEKGKTYYRLFSHYGRTGDLEKNADAGAKECRYVSSLQTAKGTYYSIFMEKTSARKGYKEVSLFSSNIGSEKARGIVEQSGGSENVIKKQVVESQLHPQIQDFVNFIYSEATTTLTNTISAKITSRGIETPLGVLSMEQIKKGEEILQKINDILKQADTSSSYSQLEALSNQFYTAIPYKIGRSKEDVRKALILTLESLEQKQEMLQLMRDMLTLNEGGVLFNNEIDNKYKALRNEIRYLPPESEDFRYILNHIRDNQVKGLNAVQVVRIFSVKRNSEVQQFTDHISNQQLMYHGSRTSNFVGLLSRGILMPKVVVGLGGKRTNFGWLGAGIYFGSHSDTAAIYAHPGSRGTRMMLLCKVALGTVKDYTKITADLEQAPEGYQSVHGVRKTEFIESDFSEDEYVIFNPNQQKQEYLVEFQTEGTVSIPHPPSTSFSELQKVKKEKEEIIEQLEINPEEEEIVEEIEEKPLAKEKTKKSVITKTIEKKKKESLFDFSQASIPQPSFGSTLFNNNNNIVTNDNNNNTFLFNNNNIIPPAPPRSPELSDNEISSPKSPSSEDEDFYGLIDKGISTHQSIPENILKIREKEDYYRGLFALQRNHPDIQDPYVNLIDVYSNRDQFKYEAETEEELAIPKILTKDRDIYRRDDEYSVVPQNEFYENWNKFTNNQFQTFDWTNVFIAGGSILGCLMGFKSDDDAFKNSDIDMFFVGISSQEEANEKIRKVYQSLCDNSTQIAPKIIRTKYAVTIINQYPYRNIQIVLRLYKSPAEVLMGFDVDSCCCGFDGKKPYVIPRSQRALNKQYNFVDMGRRSLTYEVRLFKYSKRGFAVMIPGFDRGRVNQEIFQKPVKQANGLAKLLVLEFNNSMKKKPTTSLSSASKRKRAKKEGTVSDDLSAPEEESDYSEVTIPWGPEWVSSQILKLLDNKDKAQFFSHKKDHLIHQHLFVSGIEGVLEGKSPWCKICQSGGQHPPNLSGVTGPLKWLIENPGRQLLTGSFHPVSDDNWDKEAYLSEAQKGLQPICNATFSGNAKQLVKLLSEFKININHFDNKGFSPLHHAALHGHIKCVQILLEHGANPNLEEPSHLSTPLLFAQLCKFENSFSITELLIKHGANVNNQNTHSVAPLHLACYYGNSKVISLLLSKQANIEITDEKGRKPIHYAAAGDSVESLKVLLNHNVSVNSLDSNSLSPIQLAFQRASINFVANFSSLTGVKSLPSSKLQPPKIFRPKYPISGFDFPLLKAVSDSSDISIIQSLLSTNPIDQKDRNGVTALHLAAQMNNVPVLNLLLERGLDVNIRDSRGQTPLHFAARFGSIDCGKILISKGADVRLLTFMDHSAMYMCMDVLSKLQFKNLDVFDYVPPPPLKDSLEQFQELLRKAGAAAPRLSTYNLPPQPLRARSSLPSPSKKLSPTTSPPYHSSPPRAVSPPPKIIETPQYVSQTTLSVQDFGPQPGFFNFTESTQTSTPISKQSVPKLSPYPPSSPSLQKKTQSILLSSSIKLRSSTNNPTSKLLLLVSYLFSQKFITAQQKLLLKDLILQDEFSVRAALECYELDSNLNELVDTFKIILQKLDPSSVSTRGTLPTSNNNNNNNNSNNNNAPNLNNNNNNNNTLGSFGTSVSQSSTQLLGTTSIPQSTGLFGTPIPSQTTNLFRSIPFSQFSNQPATSIPQTSSFSSSFSPDLLNSLKWAQFGSLSCLSSSQISGSTKIIGFDMDGTLIDTKSGGKFARNKDDWKWLFPEIPEKLKQLYKDGNKIVIFSNQGGVEKKKTNLSDIQGKILDIVKQLGFPIQAFLATASDRYRKPSSSMWDYFVENFNNGVKPDLNNCMYVGDAAGRNVSGKKDISCVDREFAFNIRVVFKTPEEFFLNLAPSPFEWGSKDPSSWLEKYSQKQSSSTPTFHALSQEMIILVGRPASGKSTFTKKYLIPHDYIHINQDTLKTKDACIKATCEQLKKGKSVVIDNTNPSRDVRATFISLAREYQVPVRCFIFETPDEISKHLNLVREKQTNNQVRRIPQIAYNLFKSHYQEPTSDEGFTDIKKLEFILQFESEKDKKIFLERTFTD